MEESKYPYNKYIKKMIDVMNCPYQIFSKDFTIDEVNEIYKIELKKGKQEGFTPVLVVVDETFGDWLGILEEDSYSKEAILKENLDGEKILQEYCNEEEDSFFSEFLGEKVGGETINYLSSFESYSGDGIQETVLFKIPTKNPWEVIAWLPMGGWNECPCPEEMMAICRRWYKNYGAIPAVISHDTLELIVERPIEDEQEAWKLAKEHYVFCTDRVSQCTESYTLGELADCISKSTVWYFWWD